MRIKDLMNKKPAKVSPTDKLKKLLCLASKRQSRLLHVVDGDDRLLGVISGYDLLKLVVPFFLDANLAKALPESPELVRRGYADNADMTAADLMHVKVDSLSPEDPFIELEAAIAGRGFNALPVVDEKGRLIGEAGRREALLHVASLCGCCREEDD